MTELPRSGHTIRSRNLYKLFTLPPLNLNISTMFTYSTILVNTTCCTQTPPPYIQILNCKLAHPHTHPLSLP